MSAGPGEGCDLAQVIAAIPPPIADSDWLEDVRQRLLFQIAAAHEQIDAPSALVLLSTCRHRGARTRTIRLVERLGDWKAARDLCLAAREHPESGAERQQLRRLLPRLNRRLGIAGEKTRELSVVDTFEVLLDPPRVSDPWKLWCETI